jgi:sucrose synthase
LPATCAAPPRRRYTWALYARRLLTLTSVYSFWKHVSDLDRSETKQYLSALYCLLLRKLSIKVPRAEEKAAARAPGEEEALPKHFF